MAIESGVGLSTQLERLVPVLEPHGEALWRRIDRGIRANWFCCVESEVEPNMQTDSVGA